MYGDIGHGLLITAAAALLIAFEKRLAGMFAMLYGARYLLLLMGLFATYVGFLYNDFFGIMLGARPHAPPAGPARPPPPSSSLFLVAA
eukprot:gene11177-8776_t